MASPPAPRALALGLVLCLALGPALAGCLGEDAAPAQHGTDDRQRGGGDDANATAGVRDSIEGYVTDEARTPLAGATVLLQNEDRSAVTDTNGHYAFAGLLHEQVYVLIAVLDGYEKKAQQVVVIEDKVVRLDFVLVQEPTEAPWDEVLEQAGLISCQAFAGAGHDHGGDGTEFEQGCSGLLGATDPSARPVLEFQIGAQVRGIVVEVQWDPVQPLAEFMMVTVETVGYGDLDKVFGAVIGPSVTKMEIPQGDVAKFYGAQGGILRVTVDVHYEDDDEQAAGVAAAYQQPFLVRVSNFYIEPQDKSHTAFPEGGADG